MRVLTVSDIHVDYRENWNFVSGVSASDHQDDILILAGDVSHDTRLLARTFRLLRHRFLEVLYVPGNHDLWVHQADASDSLCKFELVNTIARDCGICMTPFSYGDITIVPLAGWYDYSFGVPSAALTEIWADYRACIWPEGFSDDNVAAYFRSLNTFAPRHRAQTVITFSHFLPRIDLMPDFIPEKYRILFPVLGCAGLDEQIRHLNARIHIYGHSHLNHQLLKDGVQYINNAYGYPHENHISAKRLLCVGDF